MAQQSPMKNLVNVQNWDYYDFKHSFKARRDSVAQQSNYVHVERSYHFDIDDASSENSEDANCDLDSDDNSENFRQEAYGSLKPAKSTVKNSFEGQPPVFNIDLSGKRLVSEQQIEAEGDSLNSD